jgi:hypothetical protein
MYSIAKDGKVGDEHRCGGVKQEHRHIIRKLKHGIKVIHRQVKNVDVKSDGALFESGTKEKYP